MHGSSMGISIAMHQATDPAWCTRHYEPSDGEAFHQHRFDRTWGLHDEQVRLGLARFDGEGEHSATHVEVQYLADLTDEQGSVSLSDADAADFGGNLIYALAVKNSAGGGRLALFFRCLYAAGKAFAAAVRILRTSSPRTASSQSRSINSM